MINLMPRSITWRIVLLIMMILMANVLLTYIFSVEFQKKVHMKETVQGIRAIVSELNAHENVSGISDLIDEYHIVERNEPPQNLQTANFPILHKMADRFNENNLAKIEFFNSEAEPGYVWMYYHYPPHTFSMWLGIPKQAFIEAAPAIAFSQEIIIILMVLIGSLLVARSIRKPLKAISDATLKFGSGEIPEHVKEEGPEEVVQLAHSFNRMVDDFKNLQRERELMLAGISHDLRTPLTRLQLTIDLSRDLDELARDEMKSDIRQITDMQQQFIDYISSGTNEPHQHVNMNELLWQTVVKFEHELDHQISFDQPTEVIYAEVAPISIQRVMNNLIINAIKYGAPPIKVSLWQDERNTYISVRDQGKGVPKDQERDIFRPLFRGDSARRNAQGSGLGLAIVERIVQKHQGRIILVPHEQGFEIKIALSRCE